MIYRDINCPTNNINILITSTMTTDQGTRGPEEHLNLAGVMGWMVQPCFSGVLCQ